MTGKHHNEETKNKLSVYIKEKGIGFKKGIYQGFGFKKGHKYGFKKGHIPWNKGNKTFDLKKYMKEHHKIYQQKQSYKEYQKKYAYFF